MDRKHKAEQSVDVMSRGKVKTTIQAKPISENGKDYFPYKERVLPAYKHKVTGRTFIRVN